MFELQAFTNSSCIFSGVSSIYLVDVLDRLLMCDLCILADVFDRLLRRYRATSPNLGEEPIYHSLKR
ncbi:MAG: hypothetical protein LUD00_01785, partial [Prevotellaceae bacterium]|nr:hypothetical protein [Prevotellaceae bacterium]